MPDNLKVEPSAAQVDQAADAATELKQLLEKNLALTEEIHEMTRKIKRYINFQRFVSAIYFLIIVVPIVLSLIYLPPLLKNLIGEYQGVLGGDSTEMKSVLNPSSFNLGSLLSPKK